MKNSNRLAALVLSALALVTACEDDPAQPADNSSGNTQSFLPLTTREAVLNNLEVAWDNRVPERIDELLDEDFTFFFAAGDVGGSIPEQWSRVDEYQATRDMFISNSQPVPSGPVCKSIRVDVGTEGIRWIAIIPEGYPAETWYATTASYAFTFKMEPDMTFLSAPGDSAQFTVREVAVGNKTEWRLVEWRDLETNLVAGSGQTASTQESTWGSIKALYH